MQVLTGGFWPQQLPHTGLLPPIMQSSISKFNSWYQEKNPSRNLKWIHTLGEVVVKASYGKRSYEISLTTLQGVLLSVFDKGGPAAASSSTSTTTSTSIAPLTFLTIQELTGITNVDVLKRLLHSVSCGKYKLLTKHPASKVISIEDVFSPNSAFSTPLRKVVYLSVCSFLGQSSEMHRITHHVTFGTCVCTDSCPNVIIGRSSISHQNRY